MGERLLAAVSQPLLAPKPRAFYTTREPLTAAKPNAPLRAFALYFNLRLVALVPTLANV
jgi:hypothetical protein